MALIRMLAYLAFGIQTITLLARNYQRTHVYELVVHLWQSIKAKYSIWMI